MDRLYAFPLVAALACTAAPALATGAARAAAADAGTGAAPDIVITGERIPYGVRVTTTATKTATDVRNVPQALTIVSSQQIADQQIRSVGEMLLFVPGASYNSGEGNRDTIVLRGNSSTADFFVDGMRDDVQYFRDFYNVDRVEVLKGPNAMIFGRGGGGGIVNRVLKRPSLSVARSGIASADGWGARRFSADLDQPLTSAAAIRLNGLYENSDGFRHHVDLKRYGINPTAALLLGPDTRIDFSYEYFHDRRTADRGVPSLAGEPLRGFTRDFFGDPDDSFAKADVNIATVAIEHRFAEGMTLKNRTMVGDYNKFYQNIFANSSAASGIVVLGAYNNRNDRRNLFSQTDLVWENKLAGIDQTLLVGFEFGQE
ncbi:MAG: TonB-dependent receptor, partial [Sphingomicrobium sp.]